MELDSVQIGATDPDAAARDYAVLLGLPPVRTADGARRFQLRRGAVELESGEPGVHSIRFVPAPGTDVTLCPADAFHGLRVRFDAEPSALTADAPAAAIDHVVIHTADIDRAIALWRDRLGLRLALDRAFPARGLRMAFFRSAGVTLEFVSALAPADPSGRDRFYGLAYRAADLEAWRARLVAAGIDVSEIRPGHKPGTAVATARSGTAGVPTLLIEARE